MSELTPNLKLFKYIPSTDAKQTFNIVKCLNNNWDIVDNFGDVVNKQIEDWSANFVHVECVLETFTDGLNGYRIWSDGYCEQWGKTSVLASNTVTTITLLQSYKDTNYNIVGIPHYFNGTTDNFNENQWISAQTVSTFGIYNSAGGYGGIYWKTSGYIK